MITETNNFKIVDPYTGLSWDLTEERHDQLVLPVYDCEYDDDGEIISQTDTGEVSVQKDVIRISLKSSFDLCLPPVDKVD